MKILSFDIGGTKISSAIVLADGQLAENVLTIKTPSTAQEIEEFLQKRISQTEFDGLAVATAGVVWDEKLVAKPHNLPEGYENIKFHNLCRKPVLVENDANSALWAEYKTGVLKGASQAVMLTLGTGVGCGIICNGQMLRGKIGAAGELPFLISGKDFAALAKQNGLAESDCFSLYKMKKEHNKAAEEVYREWQNRLVDGISLLNDILDTEIVALSGSLAKIVDYSAVEKEVNARGYHNPLQLKMARTEADAGLIGAALLLKDKINE